MVLTLPGDLTVFDIGHFGVWCEAFTVDFGHVIIPPNPNVPPSLKMLGVSPQVRIFFNYNTSHVVCNAEWFKKLVRLNIRQSSIVSNMFKFTSVFI